MCDLINCTALGWGLLFVLGCLFSVAALGMTTGPRYTSGRPSTDAPGSRNRKRRKE